MTEHINFELVSPERRLVSEPVTMAVIPGTEGEMGVGAGHASFVVNLQPGVVRLYTEDGQKEPRRIFIAGGFADVTGESCTVLAEEAVNVNDMDAAALQTELKNLYEDLALMEEAHDKTRVQAKIDVTRAKVHAVTGDFST